MDIRATDSVIDVVWGDEDIGTEYKYLRLTGEGQATFRRSTLDLLDFVGGESAHDDPVPG